MQTIQNFAGNICYLSDEIYEVIDNSNHPRWPVGTLVRFISDPDYGGKPGHHYNRGWVTVCPVGVDVAKFLGFKKTDLRKVQ